MTRLARRGGHRLAGGARSYLLACAVLAACGGKSIDYRELNGGGSTGLGAGSAGSSLAGGASGAQAGATNNPGGPGAAGGPQFNCGRAPDCPESSNPCLFAVCNAGLCGVEAVAAGSLVKRDDPADCQDTVCDGNGNTMKVVDVDNTPPPSGPCFVGVCDVKGAPSIQHVPAGTPCMSAAGGKLCDGATGCVQCLAMTDCAPGQACSATHTCASAACADKLKDGDETDVDCGGSCSPCALTKDCSVDQDCVSQACDALLPHRCLTNHCTDHQLDGDETGPDCGGSCPPCQDDDGCKINADCISKDCSAVRGNMCLPVSCTDGTQDNGESDVDCGNICVPCVLGKKCQYDTDCQSQACDELTFTCVAEQCADHREDGNETDTDCGGPDCSARCKSAQFCSQDSDCTSGLHCAQGIPEVCF